MLKVVIVFCALASAICFVRQLRLPSGPIGRLLMPKLFNSGNADLNRRVFEALGLDEGDAVLDIGCGGGKLIADLAAVGRCSRIAGIDPSPEMVAFVESTLAEHLGSGLVELKQGSVESLPYDDASFDAVASVNTIYFWPDAKANICEIHRVLKPGGRCVIGFQPKRQLMFLPCMWGTFKLFSERDVHELLGDAGFTSIRSCSHSSFADNCVVATR